MLKVPALRTARTQRDLRDPKFREEPLPMGDRELQYEVDRQLGRFLQNETRMARADRVKAETAVGLMYHRSRFTIPREVVWVDSPWQIPDSANGELALMREFQDQLPMRYRSRVTSMFQNAVGRMRPEIGVQADLALAARLMVNAKLDGVEVGFGNAWSLRGNLSSTGRSAMFGSATEASLLTHVAISVLRDTGALITDSEYLRAEVTDNVWLCVPTRRIAYLCERPVMLRKDRDGNTHCEDGPAIRFADGSGVACWRGQIIPSSWVTGHPPSAMEAVTWPNMDQRAAACEIVGWAEILKDLRAEVLDRDRDPMIGELLQVQLPGGGGMPQKFLRVLCGTGRTFALPVPWETRTAIHGQSLLHDLPESVIRSIERRT